MLERIQSEGLILPTERNGLGIFDPAVATAVDNANTAKLLFRPSPLDPSLAPVPWTRIRKVLIDQSRRLTAPAVLEQMHADMRATLSAARGRTVDLAWLAGQAAIHALIPVICGGLTRRDRLRLEMLQDARLRRQIDSPFRPASLLSSWRYKVLELRSGRLIARLVNERLRSSGAPDTVFMDALIGLRDEIGLSRVQYLTQSLLIAASTAPAVLAACMLHTLASRPSDREAIAAEIGRLPQGALYTDAGRRGLPATSWFIAEALRLWTFPILTGRVATIDHEFGDHAIERNSPYTLSAHVMHRCPLGWDEPESFNPDRWKTGGRQPARGAYVPFGFGSRTCVATTLAELQLYLLCSLFAVEFNVKEEERGASRIDTGAIPFPRDFYGTISRA